jgi:hypothetical protein
MRTWTVQVSGSHAERGEDDELADVREALEAFTHTMRERGHDVGQVHVDGADETERHQAG